MTTETKISEEAKERIRTMVADSRARTAQWIKDHPGEPFPFTKLAGAWKGANFTDEEIEAAKIRSRDLID
ncbi:MAG TPA: hypothetical protein VLS25_01750 [Dehalococcoidia bacterium]|nr:hypothetical protein [Dehalococcoidia bacterium]